MRLRVFIRLALLALTGLALVPPAAAAPPALPGNPNASQLPPSPPEEDILGPREPVRIPVPEEGPSWGLWLGIGGGVLAAALLVWWWLAHRKRMIIVAPAERALTELSAIDTARNVLPPDVLADRSADAVRKFVAERFGIAAPRRTTEEFLRELAAAASSPLAAHSPLLRGFLQSCDMAKFAGAGFDAAERLTLLETARRFIRSANTPAPEQPSPATSPPP